MATSSAPSVASSVVTTLLTTTVAALSSVSTTVSHGPNATSSSGSSPSTSARDQADSPYISNFRDPFFASTFPICYALAASTVTAYMLLIMLFITPRSFLDGGVVYLGRRSRFTHSSSGGENIGGRPWLQKVAALTVAVSLTIASCDTFEVAAKQYKWGAQNAPNLQKEVLGSIELRVIRLVSNTFLWLAQAQTLVRLFPRQREKVIIKWVAFALIVLDLIFSAINSFKPGQSNGDGSYNPMAGGFNRPIPALSYMFQLLLGVLYAAWVIYYALMKKRYAFYHPLMKNMWLLALISIISILIPVVFFILDISEPEFAGWGDYVRWVGAAAASVIVWEWVERIEALEREEKKGGILGREVFDGEDMLEVSAQEYPMDRKTKHHKHSGFGGRGGRGDLDMRDGGNGLTGGRNSQSHAQSNGWAAVSAITNRQRGGGRAAAQGVSNEQPTHRSVGDIFRPHWPARPAAVATPVSRTDTPSAASTVYAVRYQPASETTGRTPDLACWTPELAPTSQPYQQATPSQSMPPSNHNAIGLIRQDSSPRVSQTRAESPSTGPVDRQISSQPAGHASHPSTHSTSDAGGSTSKPSRQHRSPTLTSSRSVPNSPLPSASPTQLEAPQHDAVGGRWAIKSRLELFAANQADKIREKLRPTTETDALPVTVIPAPPRRGAALQQVLEEDGLNHPSSSSESSSLESSSLSSSSRSRTQQSRSLELGQNGAVGQDVSSANPPLWPGVRKRVVRYEGVDDLDDEDSSDESSLASEDSDNDDELEESEHNSDEGRRREQRS